MNDITLPQQKDVHPKKRWYDSKKNLLLLIAILLVVTAIVILIIRAHKKAAPTQEAVLNTLEQNSGETPSQAQRINTLNMIAKTSLPVKSTITERQQQLDALTAK